MVAAQVVDVRLEKSMQTPTGHESTTRVHLLLTAKHPNGTAIVPIICGQAVVTKDKPVASCSVI